MSARVVVAVEDPGSAEGRELLAQHLAMARAVTPPEAVHALDIAGLQVPEVTFLTARLEGVLVGVAALKRLDDVRGEVKSMHTAAAARRAGVARALVAEVIRQAQAAGLEELLLETGSQPAFAPARALYASAGFRICGPFAHYPDSSGSVFMTLDLRSVVRLAVLADIHGNSFALEAVLEDVRRQDIERAVNLGDLLSGGVDPAGTAALLHDAPMPTVRGNHERQVLSGAPGASDRQARAAMTESDLAWFAALPEQLEVAPGVLAFHGTPGDDSAYLLESVEATGARAATDDEVRGRLGGAATGWDLLLCGHTHLARIVRLDGGATVVNPGSVGLPAYDDERPWPHVMEAGSLHARYAVVTRVGSAWEVDLRAVTYDVERAAHLAERNARPDVAFALRHGRVLAPG